MDTSSLATRRHKLGHRVEGVICHCICHKHVGLPLAIQKVLFYCDNQATVDIWQKGFTKLPDVMVLVHMLYFCVAKYNINAIIIHITGFDNAIVDALSHF